MCHSRLSSDLRAKVKSNHDYINNPLRCCILFALSERMISYMNQFISNGFLWVISCVGAIDGTFERGYFREFNNRTELGKQTVKHPKLPPMAWKGKGMEPDTRYLWPSGEEYSCANSWLGLDGNGKINTITLFSLSSYFLWCFRLATPAGGQGAWLVSGIHRGLLLMVQSNVVELRG